MWRYAVGPFQASISRVGGVPLREHRALTSFFSRFFICNFPQVWYFLSRLLCPYVYFQRPSSATLVTRSGRFQPLTDWLWGCVGYITQHYCFNTLGAWRFRCTFTNWKRASFSPENCFSHSSCPVLLGFVMCWCNSFLWPIPWKRMSVGCQVGRNCDACKHVMIVALLSHDWCSF